MILAIFSLYAIILSLALARAGYRHSPPSDHPPDPVRPKKILIVGATGGTGRELVAQGLERGYEVTAFVRSPEKLSLEHPRLRIVQGDVLDQPSLDKAVEGQEAVLSALGHKRFFYPTRILSKGTENLLRAMVKEGTRRLICETAISIGDSAGRLGLLYTFFNTPVVLPLYFWDKARQEQIVAASDRDWIIVRPGALTNGQRTGVLRHGAREGSYLGTRSISRADVAEFMLDQLESNAYLRSAPSVTG